MGVMMTDKCIRRWGLSRVWQATASVTVLLGAILPAGCRRQADRPATEDEGSQRVRLDAKPTLEFPKAVQSEDASLNRFLEDFYGLCCKGEYDKFRLTMSTRVDPLTRDRFKKSISAVERVKIESIKKLPDVADVPPPVYVVHSSVHLRPGTKTSKPDRSITILAFREHGKWVMAPAPKNLLKELDLLSTEEPDSNDSSPEEEEPKPGEARPQSPARTEG
jgi:hypothetical protein